MFPKSLLRPLFGFLLLTTAVTDAAPLPAVRLVKDIATGNAPVSAYDGAAGHPCAVSGNRMFFIQNRPDTGGELWVSDGTPQSTRMVKDVLPGPTSSQIQEMVIAGDRLFFIAQDGEHGWELWTSDGTEAGTRMVVDLVTDETAGHRPFVLKPFKNGVAFAAHSDFGGLGLWWSDGTAANTRQLAPLLWTQEDNWQHNTYRWAVTGSHLYFATPEAGAEGSINSLWRTDGTVKGTTRIREVSDSPGDAALIGAVGSTVYFCTFVDSGALLWKTNGTAAGTVPIFTLEGQGPYGEGFFALGNKGYFVDESRSGLWETNGTAAGTRKILTAEPDKPLFSPGALGNQILVGTIGGGGMNPSNLWLVNPKTLAKTAVGTPAGSIHGMACNGRQAWYYRSSAPGVGRYYYFNGTQETLIEEAELGEPNFFAATPGGLFALAYRQSGGPYGLWRFASDAPLNPVRLSPETVPASPASSYPRNFLTAAGKQFFAASTPEHGGELWVSDGTQVGTRLVKDINPGTADSAPESLTAGPNGFVYFSAITPQQGRELWRTDGTEAGTTLVKDIREGTASSHPQYPIAYAGRLFFFATTPLGTSLWSTAGAADGTDLVRMDYFLSPQQKTPPAIGFGDSLYVFAHPYVNQTLQFMNLHRIRDVGGELQITPVSPGGFYSMKALVVAPDVSQPGHPDCLHFIAQPATSPAPFQVYRCDGITPPVPLTASYGDYDRPLSLSRGNGRLVVYAGEDLETPYRNGHLWVASDSGNSLTLLTEGILLGTTDDAIYYTVRDIFLNTSTELNRIRADGSGLSLIRKLRPGSMLYPVLSHDTTLFFELQNGIDGSNTLWMTQGSLETTRQIPGLSSEDFWQASLSGDTLYLSARQGSAEHPAGLGQELYALDFTGVSLEFSQITEGGPARPLEDNDTLDPFIQAVGQTRTVTLQITNTGLRTATSLNLSGPPLELEGFAFDVTSLGDLAPGQTAQVQITFTPAAPGLQEGEFTVSASGMPDIELELTGAGLGGDSPPAIGHLPPLILAATGDTLTLKPDYVVPGASPSFRWRNSGKPAGTGEELRIAPVVSSSFGSYTLSVSNDHGFAESTPVQVAVLLPLPASRRIAEGKTLTLTCPAVGPKDSTLTHQWLRDGVPLADFDRVRGSQTRELTLADIKPGDARTYSCLVTFTYDGQSVSRSSGETEVEVVTKPEWVAFDTSLNDFGFCFIGQQVTRHEVEFLGATEVTVKGLPPGLIWRESTSRIIGRATKAGVFTVTFTAKNGAGETTKTLTIQVLPAMKPGGYDGLLDRVAVGEGNPGLGSRVLFTVAPAGTLSGQLFHDGKVYRFAGMPTTLPGEPDANRTLPVSIPVSRGKNQPGITLTFHTGSTLSAFTLGDALTGTDLTGDLKPSVVFSAEETAVYPGLGCILLKGEGGGLPGTGYLTTTVSKTGRVTWKGKLADGTAITGSSNLCRALENSTLLFGVHLDLYKATGSAHGWIRMNAMNTQRPLLIDGALTWNKLPQPTASKDRIYKEGIPLHTLGTGGGSYTPPPKGEFLLNLPPMEEETVSATGRVTIQADSIPTSGGTRSQPFKISLKHTTSLASAGTDAFLTGLTFNAAQGTFRGNLILRHKDPKLDRTASFEGVIEPAVTNESAGFFLLPDLPTEDQPASALKTTPIRSGLIQITQDD